MKLPATRDLQLRRGNIGLIDPSNRTPYLITGAKASKFLGAAVLCAAWSFMIIYLWVVSRRIGYPFELEWIEGGMVDQVQRIVQGEGIYVRPGIQFVPFLYPPMYFYISAGASLLLGGGLFPLRLVSLLASLVSFSMIFLIVRAETGDWRTGMISAGFFAATYRLSGAWLDVARVDSLFLALWLLFLYFARSQKSLLHAVLPGGLAAMAFLTKQLALLLCLPVILFFFWRTRKAGLVVLSIALSLVGITTLVFNRFSDGWYSYYIFKLLFGQTEWQLSQLGIFLGHDLLFHLPLAILCGLFFIVFASQKESSKSDPIFWQVVLLSALASAFVARMKIGGYDNVLLPAYAAISILAGLGIHKLIAMAGELTEALRHRMEIMLYLACLFQLGMLSYNPFAQVPSQADLKAGYELVQFISGVPGEVYLPDHGYLATLAGKQAYAHHSTIWDVVRAGQQNPAAQILRKDLQEAIRQRSFSMIILDSDWNYCCRQIDAYYTRIGQVFNEEGVFYPVTGWSRRPTMVYVPDSSHFP